MPFPFCHTINLLQIIKSIQFPLAMELMPGAFEIKPTNTACLGVQDHPEAFPPMCSDITAIIDRYAALL
jgi:hypothetical protein